MELPAGLKTIVRAPIAGYVAAVAIPVALTYGVTWLNMPPFVFEHLVVLLVLAVAVPWVLGPAVVSAIVSVVSDNVLLREPVGRPTITGYRDVLDLALFATVAIVVSQLMRRAHTARLVAQEAADRERRAREDRDRLIATVTHDLATPLSVLSGTVQFARQPGATQQVDLSRLLGRLETASARATSLVRMLSDAQALESDGFGLDVATHDLRALISPIVHMMDRFSERHPVLLAIPDCPVVVRVDADRLQRVFENPSITPSNTRPMEARWKYLSCSTATKQCFECVTTALASLRTRYLGSSTVRIAHPRLRLTRQASVSA